MKMKSRARALFVLAISVAGFASPERGLAACEVNGIVAKVNAPESASVGDPVFVTVSILNETDRNFNLANGLTGNPIGNGGLLGSIGYSTLRDPLFLPLAVDQLDVVTEVRKHTETVVGHGRRALSFSVPGLYLITSTFVKNGFQAVLVDRDDPACKVDLPGASSKPIKVSLR